MIWRSRYKRHLKVRFVTSGGTTSCTEFLRRLQRSSRCGVCAVAVVYNTQKKCLFSFVVPSSHHNKTTPGPACHTSTNICIHPTYHGQRVHPIPEAGSSCLCNPSYLTCGCRFHLRRGWCLPFVNNHVGRSAKGRCHSSTWIQCHGKSRRRRNGSGSPLTLFDIGMKRWWRCDGNRILMSCGERQDTATRSKWVQDGLLVRK